MLLVFITTSCAFLYVLVSSTSHAQSITDLHWSIDPQSWVKQDVVEQWLEQRSSRGQADQVFSQFKETVQNLFCYMLPGRLQKQMLRMCQPKHSINT